MKKLALSICLVLCACGGGTTSTGSGQQSQNTTPVQGSTPQGGLQVVNPLNLTPQENVSTFLFDTFNVAPDATQTALIQSQISGFARYSGGSLPGLGISLNSCKAFSICVSDLRPAR